MQIKFGTDGWRARIGEEYTFDNLRRCAQGFATFLKDNGRFPFISHIPKLNQPL